MLTKNVAVQDSLRFAASRPYITISPEPSPTRLIATCTNVPMIDFPFSLFLIAETPFGRFVERL
jgi:hypothetical protein